MSCCALLFLPTSSSSAICLFEICYNACSEEQRLDVLKRVCDKGQIIEVALNTHGTRAVQKLIETLTSREQRSLVISALGPGVVSLIKDLNGNHVVQRCLQRLGPDDSQFVYDAAGKHCVEISTHRHGCCVMQRCIDFASSQQKTELVAEIAKHALQLSQVRTCTATTAQLLATCSCWFQRCEAQHIAQLLQQLPGKRGCCLLLVFMHSPSSMQQSCYSAVPVDTGLTLLNSPASPVPYPCPAAHAHACNTCVLIPACRTPLATMWCSTCWTSARQSPAAQS
jgi:hypothetical protein